MNRVSIHCSNCGIRFTLSGTKEITVQEVEKEAKKYNWEKVKGIWICSSCIQYDTTKG